MRLKLSFLVICLFFFFPSVLHAQNLVYNGDFEIYDTCPQHESWPWDYQIEHCLGWYSPTYATPDYFNTCANHWPFEVYVPNNWAGIQIAYSGNGYLGFYAFGCYDSCGTLVQWREYVQSELLTPLIAGKKYYFRFYVSLADRSELAASKLGALFSVDKNLRNDSKPLQFNPQIQNISGNFITDTTNWTEISGIFTADGGEKYITIGHFDDLYNIDTLRIRFPTDTANDLAFYYLDGCSLIGVDDTINKEEIYIPNVFSPNGDGINDKLYVHGNNITYLEFYIYNRWGELIFNTNDLDHGWDGTYNLKNCDPAVFYYYAKVMFNDGTEKSKKGNVTLIR
jgi:gliding motility-associated-like protein